jgi:hypothetical protein
LSFSGISIFFDFDELYAFFLVEVELFLLGLVPEPEDYAVSFELEVLDESVGE